jgi:hypothetical protein
LFELEVRPAAAAGRARARAESTIAILGLNREELRRLRFQTFQTINALCKVFAAAGIPADLHADTEQALRLAVEDRSSFAAMNRHLVRQIHGLSL